MAWAPCLPLFRLLLSCWPPSSFQRPAPKVHDEMLEDVGKGLQDIVSCDAAAPAYYIFEKTAFPYSHHVIHGVVYYSIHKLETFFSSSLVSPTCDSFRSASVSSIWVFSWVSLPFTVGANLAGSSDIILRISNLSVVLVIRETSISRIGPVLANSS